MKRFALTVLMVCTLAPAAAQAQGGPLAESRYLWRMTQGNRAFQRGDYPAAQRAFRSALAVSPGSAEAHNDLGECLYRETRFGEAAGEFQKAAEVGDPQVREQATYNRGNALYRQNRLEEAADAYQNALRLDEKDGDARHNLEVVLRKLKGKQPPKSRPRSGKQQPKPESSQRKQPGNGRQRGHQKQPGGSGRKQKPPSAGRQRQPSPDGMTRQDAERILRYFQDQERAAMARRRKAAQSMPGAGAEQEPW